MIKISPIPSHGSVDKNEYFNSVLDRVHEHYKKYSSGLPSLTRDIAISLANLYILYECHTDPKIEEWKELEDEVQKMIKHIKKSAVHKSIVDYTVDLLRQNLGTFARTIKPRKGHPSTYYRKTVLPFCLPYIDELQNKSVSLAYIYDLFALANRAEFGFELENFKKAIQAARRKKLTPAQREFYRSAFNVATGAKF